MRTLIKNVLAATEPNANLTVKGWVRTRRDSKGFSFIELNDGSCLANLQVVVDAGTPGAEHLPELNTGASVAIEGSLVASPAKGQKWEMRASRVELLFERRDRRSSPYLWPSEKKFVPPYMCELSRGGFAWPND